MSMFWSKKEDKKSLPDLPPYQRPIPFPKMEDESLDDEYSAEKHELPSFPDSLNNKGFSQAAIKDAVSDDEENNEGIFPNAAENQFKSAEMEEWTPSIEHSAPSMSGPLGARGGMGNARLGEPSSLNFGRLKEETRKNTDIFVKLDKFYSARKALIDAQQKMEDINELLRRIREMKMREEQELGAWEKEMMSIKSRLNDITVNLFEKVD